MSTRANFLIVTDRGKFNFQANSSAYPSNTMKDVLTFAVSTASRNALFNKENGGLGFYGNPDSWDLSAFIASVDLTLGTVGNPSYYYEIDFVQKHVKVWDYKPRWVNAPVDWEAKGWKGCYPNSKGQFGYDSVCKGKILYNQPFKALCGRYVNREMQVKKSELEKALNCAK